MDTFDSIYQEDLLMQLEDIVDSLTMVCNFTDEKSNLSEVHGIIEVIKRDTLNLQVKLSKLLTSDSIKMEDTKNGEV